MKRSDLEALLTLKLQRQDKARAALATAGRRHAEARAKREAAAAELVARQQRHHRRSDELRRAVIGRRVKPIELELGRLELDRLQAAVEALRLHLGTLLEDERQEAALLAEARTAWQVRAREADRWQHVTRTVEKAARRRADRREDDEAEEQGTTHAERPAARKADDISVRGAAGVGAGVGAGQGSWR